MSYTFSLTGKSSLLEVDYFPPIDLKHQEYELGLINFETFNSIPNIDETNNKFYFDNKNIIEIPVGSYEIKDIADYLELKLNDYLKKLDEGKKNSITKNSRLLILQGNKKTLKSEIKCQFSIDFTKENNIGTILGFSNIILEANKFYISNYPINIFKVNIIQIICNITTGAYNNNKLIHSIFEFSPNVAAGYKISLSPTNVIYFPVIVQKINNITIKVCDQYGNLVNFRNELITIRLHLRPIK